MVREKIIEQSIRITEVILHVFFGYKPHFSPSDIPFCSPFAPLPKGIEVSPGISYAANTVGTARAAEVVCTLHLPTRTSGRSPNARVPVFGVD